MGSQGLTKGSLAFLNYPAQIMFKSTKVINLTNYNIWWLWLTCYWNQVLPVMIMGSFIPGLRRKYPVREYISALLLVIGLILFTLADAQTSPNFSIIGVVMISAALVMDSFLGNLQEAIFTLNPETTQVISPFHSSVFFKSCLLCRLIIMCFFIGHNRWRCFSALLLLGCLSCFYQWFSLESFLRLGIHALK